MAWALWISGHPERPASTKAQALSCATGLNDIFTLAWVHIQGGAPLEQLFGNARAVLVHTDAYAALMSEHGIYTLQGIMTFYKGWAVSSSQSSEAGIALMQQGLALLEAKNSAINVPYFMSLLAQAHARAGDVHSALAMYSYAQRMIRQTEEHIWLAELHRIEGEVRRAAGHQSTDVEACFARALDVSRQQGAKMFELRAAAALARLWREQGRHREAQDLLVPVYGWFTEGFDTVDLKAANKLLAELSA